MTQPFVGEIQMFGFNYNPYGWAFCNGANLPVQQFSTLYALIGNQYGGTGPTFFRLPNLVARGACNLGNGQPGLTPRLAGESFGVASVSLSQEQMPAHAHEIRSYSQSDPTKKISTPTAGAAVSLLTAGAPRPYAQAQGNTTLAPTMIQPLGNGLPHENRQPYLAVNFCIALQGVFPSFD